MDKFQKNACCDPFRTHKTRKLKSLRCVTQTMIDSHKSLHFQSGDLLCDKCRKTVYKLKIDDTKMPIDSSSSSELEDACKPGSSGIASNDIASNDIEGDLFVSPEYQLDTLNKSLQVLGESPVVKRKANTRVSYARNKAKSIHTTVKRKLELIGGVPLDDSEADTDMKTSTDYESEIISQLKEKFKLCRDKREQVHILTVLPKSWSIRKIQSEFDTSNYMARKAKKLVEDKGILSMPSQKAGRTLPSTVVVDVRAFYCHDATSRMMPGMKDYVSVNVDGERKHIQKRLVLCNLKEAFVQFKQTHSNHKIGFSKFAELRPKECVLAGGSGTHAVCVCTIHQNLKLMFHGAKLETLTEKYSYRNCLAEIQCNPPRIKCFLGGCEECPGVEKLQHRLEQHFDDNMTDHVEFKQWTTTDRSTLETKIMTVDEFLRVFLSSLPVVLNHDFIAKQQAMFLQISKTKLKPGEFLVVGDFAENYSFIIQDAAAIFPLE